MVWQCRTNCEQLACGFNDMIQAHRPIPFTVSVIIISRLGTDTKNTEETFQHLPHLLILSQGYRMGHCQRCST